MSVVSYCKFATVFDSIFGDHCAGTELCLAGRASHRLPNMSSRRLFRKIPRRHRRHQRAQVPSIPH
ncbi:hypothetical protein MPL3356_70298 [Mesorhizobium plurifarium]|uniref:Uncharacterized protein n=1 Tax=Mesorhizobium plurifarium TaxID=69974 RepID=A0A090ECK3_MESPL|nr:hypothetical protein MPL3356_70298 [Mesorhizobium plurifarium]